MNKKPDEGLVFDTAGDEPPPPKARWPLSAVERSAYRSLAIMAVLFAALLLGAAGDIAWLAGWTFLLIFFGGSLWITIDMARRDPALLAERLTPLSQPGQPAWDRVLLKVLGVVFFLWLIGMAVERRLYHWTLPASAHDLGALGLAAGFALIGLTARANTFLAPVVRMQTERNQSVVSSGPYAVIRHPMYAGALLIFFFTPLLLASIGGLAGALVLTALLVRRTQLEDRALAEGLEGYAAYAAEVRFRLIPGLW